MIDNADVGAFVARRPCRGIPCGPSSDDNDVMCHGVQRFDSSQYCGMVAEAPSVYNAVLP